MVDEALDELNRALTDAGLPRPSPPPDRRDLEALEAAVAPMRLPADVRRFWERVDAQTLMVIPCPELRGPDLALTNWRMSPNEHRGRAPLVEIAYENHHCMAAELDVGDMPGGALFEFFLDDGGFVRRFNGIAEWLTHIRRLIEMGNAFRREAPHGPYLMVPDPRREAEERELRPLPGRHAVHGDVTEVGRDVLEWPAHWQHAAGLRPEDLTLRGATHTI